MAFAEKRKGGFRVTVWVDLKRQVLVVSLVIVVLFLVQALSMRIATTTSQSEWLITLGGLIVVIACTAIFGHVLVLRVLGSRGWWVSWITTILALMLSKFFIASVMNSFEVALQSLPFMAIVDVPAGLAIYILRGIWELKAPVSDPDAGSGK